MAPYVASFALAVAAVLFVLFIQREIDRAPEHVEPDIDAIVAKVEAEIGRDEDDTPRADDPPRLKRFAA